MGVLEKLAGATPSRREKSLCLDSALQAEHDQLASQLEDAAQKDAQEASLASPAANLTAVVEQMEVLRERMKDSMVTFVIEQIPWTERLALQAKHPPRDNQVLDQIRGYNLATFLPALVKASTVSVRDASGDTLNEIPEEVWENLFKALNFGGLNALASLALEVNDRDTEIPTSARSLLGSQDSGASLARPNPGTSAQDGSEGGSPRTSPKSTTTRKGARSGTAQRSKSLSGMEQPVT